MQIKIIPIIIHKKNKKNTIKPINLISIALICAPQNIKGIERNNAVGAKPEPTANSPNRANKTATIIKSAPIVF